MKTNKTMTLDSLARAVLPDKTLKDYAIYAKLEQSRQKVSDLNNAVAETEQAIMTCTDSNTRLVLNTQAKTLREELARAVQSLQSWEKAVETLELFS